MKPRVIATERLTIRLWTASDVQRLCDLTREPGLSEYSISGYQDYSAERAARWIEDEAERYRLTGLARFAIELTHSGEIVGIAGIFQMATEEDRDPRLRRLDEGVPIEINYRLPYNRRGQGYATEAARGIVAYGFDELALEEINGIVKGENTASKKVLDRVGMKPNGTLAFDGIAYERWSIQSPTEGTSR